VLSVMKRVLLERLGRIAHRTATKVDDVMVEALSATRLWLMAIFVFSWASHYILLGERWAVLLKNGATLALFLQIGLWGTALLGAWLKRARERAVGTNVSAATSLTVLGFSGQIILWSLVALLALDNLGINVTALLAGLGVGGIAVALAVQNVLGDLFASLSIIADKPFVVGDFIIVDKYMGTVENVGLKTTRIRSLDGEQIVFSNSDLLKAQVRNYKRMYDRRVVFSFGLHYSTSPDKLEKVPALIRAIVQGQQKTLFDRAHFQKFGESSLDFEVVYKVMDPDYNLYMDIQQAINLAMVRAFAEEKIEFAYPTRTVVMEGLSSVPADDGHDGSSLKMLPTFQREKTA
jgi:small-conductance mechanosensitive channel